MLSFSVMVLIVFYRIPDKFKLIAHTHMTNIAKKLYTNGQQISTGINIDYHNTDDGRRDSGQNGDPSVEKLLRLHINSDSENPLSHQGSPKRAKHSDVMSF